MSACPCVTIHTGMQMPINLGTEMGWGGSLVCGFALVKFLLRSTKTLIRNVMGQVLRAGRGMQSAGWERGFAERWDGLAWVAHCHALIYSLTLEQLLLRSTEALGYVFFNCRAVASVCSGGALYPSFWREATTAWWMGTEACCSEL